MKTLFKMIFVLVFNARRRRSDDWHRAKPATAPRRAAAQIHKCRKPAQTRRRLVMATKTPPNPRRRPSWRTTSPKIRWRM